jgi:type 1 glutamine amidotransferase
MNEILSGTLMGYLRAQNIEEITLIGSNSTTRTLPNYYTLQTFPWDRLSEYDILVTLSQIKDDTSKVTSQDNMTNDYVKALTEFVRSGKGCVAIHMSAVPFHEDFTQMLGGCFINHPPIQEFNIQVEDPLHPITKGIASFNIIDELYITNYDPSLHILLSASYKGIQNPMTWVKTYGAGRVVYIALGHDFRTFMNPLFLKLVKQAILWVGCVKL